MKEFKEGDKPKGIKNLSQSIPATDQRILYKNNFRFIEAIYLGLVDDKNFIGEVLLDNGSRDRFDEWAPIQQPELPDLTKILKVGDKVESYRRGLGVVKTIDVASDWPIVVKFEDDSIVTCTHDGKVYKSEVRPDLFPIDQPIPAPQWPLTPQIYEWEGETYEVGEFVAVRDNDGETWSIDQFNSLGVLCVVAADGITWNEMRKLKSFNKD